MSMANGGGVSSSRPSSRGSSEHRRHLKVAGSGMLSRDVMGNKAGDFGHFSSMWLVKPDLMERLMAHWLPLRGSFSSLKVALLNLLFRSLVPFPTSSLRAAALARRERPVKRGGSWPKAAFCKSPMPFKAMAFPKETKAAKRVGLRVT